MLYRLSFLTLYVLFKIYIISPFVINRKVDESIEALKDGRHVADVFHWKNKGACVCKVAQYIKGDAWNDFEEFN